MWNDFLTVAGSVATLFLMMAVGFAFSKLGFLDAAARSQISRLLLMVVAPCVMVGTLQVDFTPELLRSIGVVLLAMTGSYALMGVIVHFLYPRQRPETRACLRFGTVFGNIGFMGLPLVTSVLGEEAAVFCAIALIAFNALTWTYGVALMGARMSLRRAVLNPGVLGGLLALALFLLRIRLPGPVLSAVDYFGDLNTPLAMVVIGSQMAEANLPRTFRQRRLYGVCVWKLAVFPLLTMLVLLPFHLDRTMYLTLVILAGCPTAGATSMYAEMFERDTASAAQLVTLSTLLSILTLPVVALLAKQLVLLL